MSSLISISFSRENPSTYPSLAPTFLTFKAIPSNTDVTPPGITQLPGTGLYYFLYGATTPTYFLLDGITTAVSSDRYVFGVLDPLYNINTDVSNLGVTVTSIGNTAIALGTTAVAIGTTGLGVGVTTLGYAVSIYAEMLTLSANSSSLSVGASILNSISDRIGFTTSTFGDVNTDPGTLYGYLKRTQEFLEGDATFTKLSGAWNVQSRGGSLLAQKTLNNTASQVTKV